MKTFGRHWGVICRDKLNEMIDVVGQFDATTQFYQIRRVIKNYIQSCRQSKLGDNYSHKVGKLLNGIFSMRDVSVITRDLFLMMFLGRYWDASGCTI